MTKTESITAAKEKANLSKQNQVVFSYTVGGDPAGWTVSAYDYTPELLWERRHYYIPVVTKVVVVTPDTHGGKKVETVK